MKIQWLGHSCFRLVESTGTAIVTDPYDSAIVGYEMPKVQADAITLSHQHDDHNAVRNVQPACGTVLDKAGSWDVKGVGIASVVSHHDADQGARRGVNHIFKFRMDGVDLCHLGDIGEECTTELGESIGTVNVLMIPIGGNYTIDAQQAKEYVDLLMPDIVIPMHYKTPSCDMDIDKRNAFLQLFDDEQIVEIDGCEVEFDRSHFDGDCTKVIVFETNCF